MHTVHCTAPSFVQVVNWRTSCEKRDDQQDYAERNGLRTKVFRAECRNTVSDGREEKLVAAKDQSKELWVNQYTNQ